ncbi:Protein containing domains DUF404, DUF407,DUF403 [Pseudoalteromonas luteoviolacea B = ATCC 29581]|nr:Protein containing domains DUF404, DUF407,DUF403 [Pseudoalteromonas luteoviolacea B = ATCC 29581]
MSEQIESTATEIPSWLSGYLQASKTQGQFEELLKHLSHLSGEELNLRASEITRLLRNGGFVESGDAVGWKLDPLPFLLSNEDWQYIEAGVKQRVKLLTHIVKDVYSGQKLVTQNIINAQDLFNHPEYLREVHTLPKSEVGLFMLAIDIAKTEQGEFYVLNEHGQFPRGLGMLLESRIIARRVMSEEFKEYGVQRIAVFFQSLQRAINNALNSSSDPRVVILSTGPNDKYYSEQTFLASYLGYTLVRSADLTVRKGKVWLKALDGLRKVDVIVRWVNDRHLDSLEQQEYSEFGVPGLLQALRKRKVKLLNPFGSNLLGVPATRRHIDTLCQSLLGEPLTLKEPKTFAPHEVASENWAHYELRAKRDNKFKLDSEKEFDVVQREVTNNPEGFYFKEKVPVINAPFWGNGQLINKPVAFRVFVLMAENQVHLLPSAMCFSLTDNSHPEPMLIKDCWLQHQQFGSTFDPLSKSAKLPQKIEDMALVEGLVSSRSAENLFWLGSGLERAENLGRLLRLFIERYTEQALYPDENNMSVLTWIANGIEAQHLVYPYHVSQLTQPTCIVSFKTLARGMLNDKQKTGSLALTVSYLINSGLQVRELLSYDSMRMLENLKNEIGRMAEFNEQTSSHAMQSSIDSIVGNIMAFNGSLLDSMPVVNGSFMLDMGRRVERIVQLIAMIDTLLTTELDPAEQLNLLDAVLAAQVSSITHRRRYRTFQSVATGLELLLLDAEYPRSLVYQINALLDLTTALPTKGRSGFASNLEKILIKLKADILISDNTLLSSATEKRRSELQKLMREAQSKLTQFQELVQLQYFTHTKTATKVSWQIQ